jgi:hypothetical protein
MNTIAERTHEVTRNPSEKYDWTRAKFTAKLHQLHGNQHPYFSITGETWIGRREDMGGCIHDVIAEYWPDMRPFLRLHLSDDTGTPMHGGANGAHWAREYFRLDLPDYDPGLGNPRDKAKVREILRDHLRLSDVEVDALLEECARVSFGFGIHPVCWKAWAGDEKITAVVMAKVETLRERWAAEAAEFLTWLKHDGGTTG